MLLVQKDYEIIEKINTPLDKISKSLMYEKDNGDKDFAHNKESTMTLLIIVCSIVLVIMGVIAIVVIKSVTRLLKIITNASERIALCDTNVEIVQNSKDEI